jgi:hypothetical protein
MNPQAPRLKAKIKIHKPSAHIRPIISGIYATTHKITKHIHQKLKDLINLKHGYNIVNTTQFMENVSKLKLDPEHKLLTMDIKVLYVKIPINYSLNIANKLLNNNRVNEQIIRGSMSILKMIMNQNYFQHESKLYKPTSGVAMGSPLFSITAEIFLQKLEQNRVKHLLEGKKTVYYNIYIDDIFIIYNQIKTTPQTILEQFNAQYRDLQFTINEETDNQIA